ESKLRPSCTIRSLLSCGIITDASRRFSAPFRRLGWLATGAAIMETSVRLPENIPDGPNEPGACQNLPPVNTPPHHPIDFAEQRNRLRLTDVHDLYQRIEQLEGALAQARAEEPVPRGSASTTRPAVPAGGKSRGQGSVVPRDGNSCDPSEPTSASALSPTISYLGDTSSAELPLLGPHIGPNWFFRGMHVFSDKGREWISIKTGQPVDLGKLEIFVDNHTPLLLPPQPPETVYELPEQSVAREISALFFQSPSSISYPILNDTIFAATIEEAYDNVDNAPGSAAEIASRACVLGALAMMTRSIGSRQALPAGDFDLLASKARLLLASIVGHTSLTTLETTLTLYVRSMQSGHWQDAAAFLPTACSMVCALGGHTERAGKAGCDEPPLTQLRRRHVRNLFWFCYIAEKDRPLRTGQPPLLTDAYCDLSPPDECLSCCQPSRESTEHCDVVHASLHVVGDVLLSQIKEKTFRLLYSPRAIRERDGKLLSSIRLLDEEIEKWRLSNPPDFRPALSISPQSLTIRPGMKGSQLRRYLNLQLEYHYIIIFVHTTVRRYDANTAPGDAAHDLHSVIHSSYDLSLEAGRSTLRCLKLFLEAMDLQAFWSVIFFTVNAAISLFLDMLIHPQSATGQLDLELLISSANTVRSVGLPLAPTREEGVRVQAVSDFIMWMVWLGSCAITKAREEPRDTHRP
ncbi:fungal specific transcription factor, partial [Colletotrichum plurivorum]